MKICQHAFEGHGKDRKAGASSEGGPQTNALTGEGIKPQALRVGLNCAALLKIQQKHLYCECSRWLRLDPVYVRGKKKKSNPFSLKLFASNISCFC